MSQHLQYPSPVLKTSHTVSCPATASPTNFPLLQKLCSLSPLMVRRIKKGCLSYPLCVYLCGWPASPSFPLLPINVCGACECCLSTPHAQGRASVPSSFLPLQLPRGGVAGRRLGRNEGTGQPDLSAGENGVHFTSSSPDSSAGERELLNVLLLSLLEHFL